MIVFLLMMGSQVAGIATAGGAGRLRRVDYAWRVACLVIAGLLVAFAIQILESPHHLDLAVVALMLVTVLILAFFGARWSVYRLNHMGQPRWWALLLLPVINLLTVIGLSLIPGQPAATPASDSND